MDKPFHCGVTRNKETLQMMQISAYTSGENANTLWYILTNKSSTFIINE